jgi:hypothetical protein
VTADPEAVEAVSEILARAWPSSVDEIVALDGIRHWQVEAVGSAILEAVTRNGGPSPEGGRSNGD